MNTPRMSANAGSRTDQRFSIIGARIESPLDAAAAMALAIVIKFTIDWYDDDGDTLASDAQLFASDCGSAAPSGPMSAFFMEFGDLRVAYQLGAEGNVEPDSASLPCAVADFDEIEWLKVCNAAADEAAIGCGQSDVLWFKRCSALIKAKIASLPEQHQERGLELAIKDGFCDDGTQESGTWEDDGPSMQCVVEGDVPCPLTGIDPHYCPCGSHP
jgi:hypothetical protein